MQKERLGEKIIIGILAVCVITAITIAIFPLWNRIFQIQPIEELQKDITKQKEEQQTELQNKTMKQVRAQLLFSVEEEELTQIWIEVLNLHTQKAYYLEVPVNTKLTLSPELYQKLLTYSPELSQYMKLAKLPGFFSEDYCMKACQQIMCELLDVKINDWILMDTVTMEYYKQIMSDDNPKTVKGFFDKYKRLLKNIKSNQSVSEQQAYFEAYLAVVADFKGTVPGIQQTEDYILQKEQTAAFINELLL